MHDRIIINFGVRYYFIICFIFLKECGMFELSTIENNVKKKADSLFMELFNLIGESLLQSRDKEMSVVYLEDAYLRFHRGFIASCQHNAQEVKEEVKDDAKESDATFESVENKDDAMSA